MLLHSALLVSLLAAGQAAQMLAGGKTVVPIDDEIIAMSMRGINSQLNAVSNENAHYVVTQILKAEKQVVAGVLYHLEVLVQESTCTKSQTPHTEVSAESCPPVEHGKQKVCKLKIWQKPWENNFEEIENVGCKTFSGNVVHLKQKPPKVDTSEPAESGEDEKAVSGPGGGDKASRGASAFYPHCAMSALLPVALLRLL